MLAAEGVNHIWFFWLGVPLVLTAVALLIGMMVGYLRKVVRPRYPQD